MNAARIALAQINPTVGDLAGNVDRCVQAIEVAASAGVDLVALPELVITGYPPEDLVLRPSFVEDNLRALDRLAERTPKTSLIVGFIDRQDDKLYNAAALITDGQVAGIYHKHRLPNYGVFDEERYFEEGERVLLGRLGDTLIGLTICEDLWFVDGPHASCAAAGASLVVNINGSPYETVRRRRFTELSRGAQVPAGNRRKIDERIALAKSRAAEQQVAIAYVNMVGGQDELVFDGGSFAVAADGSLLAKGAQFEEEVVIFDFGAVPGRRGSATSTNEGVKIVDLPVSSGEKSGSMVTTSHPALRTTIAEDLDPTEEVYRALVLGVRDYLRKLDITSVLVGISGGIDSALTAAIGAEAIGAENVTGILNPSEFTSQESLELAKELVENLGIQTLTLPISDAFETLLKTLDPVFAGTEPGVAEENLQSRIRGVLWMAISNKRPGCIVLSTGNKSELATGYATLYGDMAGGFAVLKDVPKTLVYELAEWRNRQGEVIPRRIIDREPTAELRANQLDTDSLPPYEVLDPILQAYVEDDRGIDEIVGMGFDRAMVENVANMVDRAEYKRRQAPPGIKITERAFGRDRRLPIANRYRQKH